MEIYKYLPRKPGSVIGDGTSQKYFSESAFASSLEASQYLSVPYEPAYRVKIDDLWLEPDEEGLWEVFAGSATRETRRRVWAAFGLHGGAWERVTSKQFLGETEMEHRREGYAGRWSVDCILPTGGFIGEYSSFLLPTEHDFLASLLTRFLRQHKSRGEAGEFGEFKEGFQWKVPDDLVGGIFYFKLGNFEYTISVLVRKYEGFYNGTRFWGCFWKDDQDVRETYRPVEVVVPGYPLVTEQELRHDDGLKKAQEFEEFLHHRFDDVRKMLSKKTLVLRTGLIGESRNVRLP